MNYGKVAENIRAELKTYLENSGLKSIVLGISGGIDSAICVALAKPVCDELGIEIIGRFISIESNKQDEVERGNLVGRAFCHNYGYIDLTAEYSVMAGGIDMREGQIGDSRADKIRLGNVKARMRMIYIYNLAQRHSGMVLSTDNYTELLLGFWTLHGDVGDYGMIQNLWKMEVYGLAQWIADNECEGDAKEGLQACIDATPTDGLGITSSDVEQLGAKNYAEVDGILQRYTELKDQYESVDDTGDKPNLPEVLYEEMMNLAEHTVVKRYYGTMFKRENPYNLPREVIVKDAE